MVCVCSKRVLSVANASPVLDFSSAFPPAQPLSVNGHSSMFSSKNPSGSLSFQEKQKKDNSNGRSRRSGSFDIDKNGEDQVNEDKKDSNFESKKLKRRSSGGLSGQINFKFGFSQLHFGAEQIAAGWPNWLTSAAAEAIHGWVPLKPDAFEKLQKGT